MHVLKEHGMKYFTSIILRKLHRVVRIVGTKPHNLIITQVDIITVDSQSYSLTQLSLQREKLSNVLTGMHVRQEEHRKQLGKYLGIVMCICTLIDC